MTTDQTEYAIVGVYGYAGGRDSLGGGTEIAFTTAEAQRLFFEGDDAYSALAVHAAEDGSVDDRLRDGIVRAEQALDSGRAQDTLERWVAAASHGG